MKHTVITAILIVALFSVVGGQTINNQTFSQMVENSNGQMSGSVRTVLKNDSHIFVSAPASSTGHSYLSFNSLGKSSLTPAQVMNAIKADPSSAFPYFNADGECGQRVRKGNEYSLNINVAGFKPIENPVQVTDVGSYHFTFSTLPNHTLEGSATHGVFKDGTGELWLFQVGKGVANEATWKQELNYGVAEKMWSQMANNVKEMMPDIKPSDQSNNSDESFLFRVNNWVSTGIPIKRGDKIVIKASGKVKFGGYVGSGGPEGIVGVSSNYNYFDNIRHGSLIVRVRQPGPNTWEGWIYAGTGGETISKDAGILEFDVNDNEPENNVGNFCVEVVINPVKR